MLENRQVSGRDVLYLFIFAHFSHHLCTSLLTPLLPQIRDAFELDYFRSGLLISAFSFVYGLMALPMATLSDRMSKRVLLGAGLIGVSLSAVGIGLSTDYYQLMALLVLMGFFGSTYHPPASAFLSQVFDKRARGRSLGLHVVGGSSAFLATPLAGVGIATLTGNWRMAFIVLALPTFLAGLAVLLLTRSQDRAMQRAALSQADEPIAWVSIARTVGFLVLLSLILTLVMSSVNAYLPLFLVDYRGVPWQVAGIVSGLVAFAGVFGAPLGGMLSDRFGRKPVIASSVLLAGPFVYLITVIPYGWPLFVAIFLYGLALSSRQPVMDSLIADVVPDRRRGTVLGAYYFLTGETSSIITPFMGGLMNTMGIAPVFTGLAVATMAASSLVLFLRNRD